VQTIYYAADAPTPDLTVLAATEPARWGELHFAFAPAWARLDSPHPLHDIWRVNAEGYLGDMSVDFGQSSRLMVLRRSDRVHVLPLSAAAAEFVDALAADASLAQATAAAIAVEGDFDPAIILQDLVRDGIIVGAALPDTTARGAEHADN
jgi:hypothetical protein